MSAKKPIIFAITGAGVILLSLLLAWISQDFASIEGWLGFAAAGLLAALLVWLAFVHLRGEELPDWMVWLVAGAILFRLALGAFWFYALPKWGYPTDQQQAGYIMFDPFLRDNQAWELAQSGEPLLEAFRGYTAHDQYGGMLFISAWLYRYLGGSVHLPQLVLILTSAASGIGALYTWAFTRRLWGGSTANWAAIGLAIYPEAVMLGGAHMREAFTITLGGALGYLVVRYWQERRMADAAVFAFLLGITLAISWAFVVLLSAVLGLFAVGLWLEGLTGKPLTRTQWTGVAVGGTAAAAAGWLFWGMLSRMSEFQGVLTETYSGVVQAVFDRTPGFLHVPFLVGYGMVRPMLPAAIIGKGESWLWRGLGIWRAVGWTALLALLLYATLLVIKKKAWLRPPGMLLWGNWLMAAVAAYRAGGDLWDNPRYRAGFAAFQMALAAWAVAEQRVEKSPLLRRVLISAGIILFWVMAWYLPRYVPLPWGAGRVEIKVGIGLVTVGLYLLWDWLRSKPKTRP